MGHCRLKEIADTSIKLHSAGRFIIQWPGDFNQPVVDVVFFSDSPEVIMPDTVERFLEVVKELVLMFQMLFHQQP